MQAQRPNDVYTPRPGSKVSLAIQALLDGPMTSEGLAAVMSSPTNSVRGMLYAPVERGLLLRVQDATGLLHYALAGMAIDEQFTPYQGREPSEVRKPVSPILYPQARMNVDPADPFGLVAKKSEQPAVPAPAAAPVLTLAPKPKEEAPVPEPVAAPIPLAAPVTCNLFEAAVFSSGDLLISVGIVSVRLTPEHQRQLNDFMSRCGRQSCADVQNGTAKASAARVRRICADCGARRSEVHFSGSSKVCITCKGES